MSLPSIFGGPLGLAASTGLFAAQIHADTYDSIRAEHPDWSEAQVKEMTDKSTAFQLAPQIVLTAIHSGQLGDLISGLTQGGLTKRIVGNAIVGLGGGATAAGAQQIAANYAEGKPLMQGVPEAAIAGAVQAIPGAAIGVTHGAPERVAVPEPEIVPRGAISEAPRPEEVRPQPSPAEAPPVAPGVPVTQEDVARRAYEIAEERARAEAQEIKPGSVEAETQSMGPLGYRAAVRLSNGEIFSGMDHAAALDNASENGSIRVTDQTTQFGFRDKNGAFVSMEEADQILEKHLRTQAGQPNVRPEDWTQAQAELSRATEPVLPAPMSEAEPITSAIANRYVQERMAFGELGEIEPGQGQSTEDMVMQGLQMSPTQRDGLIDAFMKGKGGDFDQQGAAIRSKEALLSEQAKAASRALNADPANQALQAQAKAASDAVTAFHNGPIKKFKQDWSNAGRGLQREIPLDYTTFNGMKEAYLKNQNKEVPSELEPRLKQMADAATKAADAERVAMNNLGKESGNQIRGKTLSTDDQIRTRLMELMKDLPCPT
jgi:hypothetical protein